MISRIEKNQLIVNGAPISDLPLNAITAFPPFRGIFDGTPRLR